MHKEFTMQFRKKIMLAVCLVAAANTKVQAFGPEDLGLIGIDIARGVANEKLIQHQSTWITLVGLAGFSLLHYPASTAYCSLVQSAGSPYPRYLHAAEVRA